MTLEPLSSKGCFLTITIGVFNVNSNNWYSHDKTSLEGSAIESSISQFRLHHLINGPTPFLQNSSLYIDLILTHPFIGIVTITNFIKKSIYRHHIKERFAL